MERDFMGLNFKESVAAVKEEEVSDGLKDSAPTKAPGSQWPFTNKVSAIPHFMHHISSQEDPANKTAASSVASSGFSQNLVGSVVKQSRAPGPSAASIAGIADTRWNKSVESQPQMTIFYNGTVKVYDSITLEKAQAIMFLAGNGSSLVTSAGAQARPLTPKFAATDVLPVNQLTNAQPSSTMSSPISVSSDNGTQSVSGSTCTDEMVNHKPSSIPFSPDCKMDPPKPIIAAKGSAAASSMIPRGIPQFRKVSLARFLEKRKERAMNAAPYNAGKKPECAT